MIGNTVVKLFVVDKGYDRQRSPRSLPNATVDAVKRCRNGCNGCESQQRLPQ